MDSKQTATNYKLFDGLVYSGIDSKMTLDLYIPEATSEPIPCIIVIQGGGFLAQDGQRFRHFAEFFAVNGSAAALISYRGRPNHTYRETISDTKAAVRYVRSVSDKYGINPDKIGAMGRSAGATLAVLLAVTGNDPELEGNDGRPGISSQIQAAAGIAGVYDFVGRFTAEEQVSIQPHSEAKIESCSEWVGTPFSATGKDWQQVSAVTHIKPGNPPILLIHSKDDTIVPWMQSRDMHESLIKAGNEATIELFETGGHAGPEVSKELMLMFFKRFLT